MHFLYFYLELLKKKASIEIPVDKGRTMFGVIDETYTLEYGQVFVQYSNWETDALEIRKGTNRVPEIRTSA